jgi:hypothetical protein
MPPGAHVTAASRWPALSALAAAASTSRRIVHGELVDHVAVGAAERGAVTQSGAVVALFEHGIANGVPASRGHRQRKYAPFASGVTSSVAPGAEIRAVSCTRIAAP